MQPVEALAVRRGGQGHAAVATISAGQHHCVALRRDGTVMAWGWNAPGINQATVPAGLSNVAGVSAGRLHNLALLADGSLVGWGANTHGETTVAAGAGLFQGIAAGGDHSLALVPFPPMANCVPAEPLRLKTSWDPVERSFRFSVHTLDGVPVPVESAPWIDVFTTTDLSIPAAMWRPWEGGTYPDGGTLSIKDAGSAHQLRRFFRVQTRP